MNKPLPENFLAHELAKIAETFNPDYERELAGAVATEIGCPEWLETKRCDADECFCLKAAHAARAVRRP